MCQVWWWMDLFSAANIFLKLCDKEKKAILTNFQTFLHFVRKKDRWNFKIFFSKLVHRKGCFGEIRKNSIFRHWFSILEILWRPLLRTCWKKFPISILQNVRNCLAKENLFGSYMWVMEYFHKHFKLRSITFVTLRNKTFFIAHK